jgi:hypothetical protein
VFLAELNGLDTWAMVIGNAYLEAETKERLYIIASDLVSWRVIHLLLLRWYPPIILVCLGIASTWHIITLEFYLSPL